MDGWAGGGAFEAIESCIELPEVDDPLEEYRGDGAEVFDTVHDGKRNTDQAHGYEIITD